MNTAKETKQLLLISNSTLYGSGFLDHAAGEIHDFLGSIQSVLFFPFALHDQDAYAEKVRARFETLGYGLTSVHHRSDKREAVQDAEAVFIGGGNTFRLLKALYDFDLLMTLKERVESGVPYVGSSAGSNVAAPTIRTTNDMPIVEPPSLNALALVSFQINPHYVDPDPHSTRMGETREERILQYLEENDTPVVGLREGAMLRHEEGSTILKGSAGARIFRRGKQIVEVMPGRKLNDLISP
jgi:dipeptidase E